ncbi:hypothetical protein GCM10010910_17660 [Microbacterium nanhaiense]|uniref:Acyl carrier protein n=1 Tax=Microbacterium nanhaiense TaxID=1301026 RepID=A0ABQ2N0G4_9MICO|nr:hypothetical protein [Microbacterium nanhaiense]GGO63953.1 hypothetical protein GCM10010910_17660 [Microbacterium nanhaiense]
MTFHDLAERVLKHVREEFPGKVRTAVDDTMWAGDWDTALLMALGEDLEATRRIPRDLRAELASHRDFINDLPAPIAQAITEGL